MVGLRKKHDDKHTKYNSSICSEPYNGLGCFAVFFQDSNRLSPKPLRTKTKYIFGYSSECHMLSIFLAENIGNSDLPIIARKKNMKNEQVKQLLAIMNEVISRRDKIILNINSYFTNLPITFTECSAVW